MVTGATATRNDGWLGKLLWGTSTDTGLTGCTRTEEKAPPAQTADTPYELSLTGNEFAAIYEEVVADLCTETASLDSKALWKAVAQRVLEKQSDFADLNPYAKSVAIAILAKKLYDVNGEKNLEDFLGGTSFKAMCLSQRMSYFWQVGGLADRVWLGVTSDAAVKAIALAEEPLNFIKIQGPTPSAMVAEESKEITITLSIAGNTDVDLSWVELPEDPANYLLSPSNSNVAAGSIKADKSTDGKTVTLSAALTAASDAIPNVSSSLILRYTYLAACDCIFELGTLEKVVTITEPVVEEPEAPPPPAMVRPTFRVAPPIEPEPPPPLPADTEPKPEPVRPEPPKADPCAGLSGLMYSACQKRQKKGD